MSAVQRIKGLYSNEHEHDSCGIGFVAHIKGKKSHEIVRRGLEVLERMEHRGAESADNRTGDGAGIMLQIPHQFYSEQIENLPDEGSYGTGLVFFPKNTIVQSSLRQIFESVLVNMRLRIIGWRDVDVDSSVPGEIAKQSEPRILQLFIADADGASNEALERKLFLARKIAEQNIRTSEIADKEDFYIVSLSSKTIVYKGMFMPHQLRKYYRDLQDERLTSAIAMVHSRFSTNTFPAWGLAQPFRIISHNGEINTIKGNRFWMSARESDFRSDLFGESITYALPVIEPEKSDSASLDNAIEFLVMAGRTLPHTLMMLIPESWNDKNPIPQELKYFYEYHAAFMEPWDGPASIVFCDGRFVGGTLDRNGLRPSRYVITKNDIIVMGSEVGVQDFRADEVRAKGRLMPGKLLLVDTKEGRIIPDKEIKQEMSRQKPYTQWVEENRVLFENIPYAGEGSEEMSQDALLRLQLMHGYTREDVELIIKTTAETAQEPTSSMGTDTPLAALSDKPQRLFNYFKQAFAQVTNPPIDSVREDLVMTLTSFMGRQLNLLDETPEHCRMIKFLRPIFRNSDVEKLRHYQNPDFKAVTIPIVFPASNDAHCLSDAMDEICAEAEKVIDAGHTIIILSDKKADATNAPIPSLLACAGVHHHLIRVKKRTRAALVIETAEAREVMHMALLFGYGADAVNPYGAIATIRNLHRGQYFPKEMSYDKAVENFIKANEKALLKVLSKMGISTLRSYRGAQVFEAIGLGNEVIEKYFTGTPSRIGGIGVQEIAREALMSHRAAFDDDTRVLPSEGVYAYRKYGEKHSWNPVTIHLLQWAVRTGDYQKFKEFSAAVNGDNSRPHVIRGLFEFSDREPIPIEEVEPVETIMKRLTTGAMSFGSISKEAHETIAIAMNTIGGRSNSGEGGEDPERYVPKSDGTFSRSAIKQVASGRFGVTSAYLAHADELQIKMAQGAKPGEGGQLPGHKVDKIIAKTRHSTPGVTLISPPPHHDIYSIEDLAELIFDLKNANPNARISVKLVSETGVGTVAAGVAKAHADNILISGYDGGTGASPLSSIKHAGIPWEIGLSETHQTLVANKLRGRVRLQTDGQLKTGRDVVIAAILGAEEFGFGTATLISLGCVMMRKCHMNTCPVGVATQDPQLRKRFRGKPEHVVNFFTFIAREVRELMASLGIRKFDDLIGRTELLKARETSHWKARFLNLSSLVYRNDSVADSARYCVEKQVHKIDRVIDRTLVEKAMPVIKGETGAKLYVEMPIKNTDRATGAMLSYYISKKYGDDGLPDDTIECVFRGSAGQSFGAFLTRGITFRLEGDANDYFGKGLSGGKLIVHPPDGSDFSADENIIVGNTVLYGATSGEAYIRGIAGERFCVRNSNAIAVVEGTGDHCAEYMTGGRILVLGRVGRNFAAGMSGGIAYVLDVDGNFDYFCNKGMVDLSPVRDFEDQDFIIELLRKHYRYTGSAIAERILREWHAYVPNFVKVIPFEYKRALQELMIEQIELKLKRIREEEQLEVHA